MTNTDRDQHETAHKVERVWREFPDVSEGRNGTVHFVASRSTSGAWWRIELREVMNGQGERVELPVCTCPAGEAEPVRMCWHRRRLYEYLGAMRDARKRPTAPTNIAAICD